MSNGKFESSYWGNLPSILQETNKQTNWLHILTDDFKMSNSYAISRSIKKFNLLGKNYQNHALLDSFLSIKIIIKTLQEWNNLQSKFMKIEKVISVIPSEQLQLWPLFRKEYEKTSYGIRTAENILTLNLFEKACALLPKQSIGVYLFEQQPWEFSLLYSWKNFSHGKIIGAQHSTILFWDLRYFSDSQSYLNPDHYRLPMPNKIAVNGPVAFDTLIKAGYQENDIVLTEALRYLNLSTPNLKQNLSKHNNKFLRILVMADYLEENSNFQIKLLEESIHLLPFKIKITIKPHPSRAIKATDFSGLEFDISNEPLSDLLQHTDVAYSSAATSAAVDAYYSGIPVISVINPSELNLSPLRGVSGVFYVSTPQSLIETLNNIRARKDTPRDLMNFFTIDQALPKWRTLLELNILKDKII
jgi:surface carbohydrate biosynthesis protein (TIGR04326 family)